MENEAPDRRKRDYSLRRSIYDYGMGIIILGIGVALLAGPRLGLSVDLDNTLRYFLAGLFLLYGGFRIYRGYNKNYFN